MVDHLAISNQLIGSVGSIVRTKQAVGRDILDLDRMDIDVDILVEIRAIECNRNLRRCTAHPRIERHLSLVDRQQRSLSLVSQLIDRRNIGRSREETEHRIVLRHVAGIPRQRDIAQIALALHLSLVGRVVCNDIETVLAEGNRIVHREGRAAGATLGEIRRIGVRVCRRRGFLGRELQDRIEPKQRAIFLIHNHVERFDMLDRIARRTGQLRRHRAELNAERQPACALTNHLINLIGTVDTSRQPKCQNHTGKYVK